MKNVFKLILAVILLLCLAPVPYGYFQLVRLFSTIAFGLMAYRYYKEGKEKLAYTFGTLVLLFQPFYKISLGRTLWNVIDVIVALGLIALFIWERRRGGSLEKANTPIPPDNPIIVENVDDNKIEFKLDGKLNSKELIYVANEEDKALEDLFETKPEVFEGWGKMMGFQIIYLPLLMKRLADKEVLHYRAPYLSEAELARTTIGNDFLLQYLEHPGERGRLKHGFIRTEDIHRGVDGKDRAVNRFYPLSSNTAEPMADQLHRIGKQIYDETNKRELPVNKSSKWIVDDISFDDYQRRIEEPTSDADVSFNSQLGNESIDDLLEEVKERITKLRQRGISQYILEQLIHPDDRLSRMVITKDYRIMLPDYNNMEIKMEPIVKAVYLLFLNHPEGILFKHLPDYREELAQIYNKVRPLGLTDRAVRSIEDVTNPLLNSINEKCARIRGAFVGQFDDHMARHYYIDGLRGEAKKISLPRELVVWE